MEEALATFCVYAVVSGALAVPMAAFAWLTRSVDSLFGGAIALLVIGAVAFAMGGMVAIFADHLPVGWFVVPGAIAGAVLVTRARARFVQRGLDHAARRLGLAPEAGRRELTGRCEEAEITLDFDVVVTRSSKGGTSKERYPRVRAAGPRVPIHLELRRQLPVGMILSRIGYAIDLRIGRARFDWLYIVEGAPEDLIAELLTPEVTDALVRQRPLRLRLEEGKLSFEFRGWRLLPRQIDDLVEIATQLAGRAPKVLERAERQMTASAGSPFRESIDATQANLAKRERAAEIEALHATRDRRRRLFQRVGLAAFVAVAAIVVWRIFTGE